MKKIYIVLALPLLFAACKPKSQSTIVGTNTDTVKYAYSIKKPDNWIMDTSTVNTRSSLNTLKAYENGDTAAMRKYFADTIVFNYDGGNFKGTLNQVLTLLKQERDSYKSVKVIMTDWEPVVSKDGKEKWVSLWYTRVTTDLKGKTDSVAIVNDDEYKNGKIIRDDEYIRNLK
jgi:hypothetical protein